MASVQRKLAYDLHYVQQLSFALEARIYLATGLHPWRFPHATFAGSVASPTPSPLKPPTSNFAPGRRGAAMARSRVLARRAVS